MNAHRILLAAVFTAIGLAGGYLFLTRATTAPAVLPLRATVLPEARALPDFSLTDQNGKPFTQASLTGGWHLLFFGFTHCPDICPVTLQQLAATRRQLAAAAATPLPDIVLISVDPARDTPTVLADYIRHFGDGITGATGTLAELHALTRPLGIHFEKSPGTDGDYSVDHSAAVLAVDPLGRFAALFSAPHDVASFVHDLPLIMARQ